MPPKISDLATDEEVRLLSGLDKRQWLMLEVIKISLLRI